LKYLEVNLSEVAELPGNADHDTFSRTHGREVHTHLRGDTQHQSTRLATLVCDAPARQRRRPARHTGAVGPRAAFNDAGLYTRFDGEVDRGLRQGASEGVVFNHGFIKSVDRLRRFGFQ